MTTQEKIEKISLNGREYVPADSVEKPGLDLDGLKYAIVRSRDQGVMAGFVKSINGRAVTLLRARQLWSFSSQFVLIDLAEFGPTEKFKNKFSAESSQETIMLEACGVMYCSAAGALKIRNVHAQVCT